MNRSYFKPLVIVNVGLWLITFVTITGYSGITLPSFSSSPTPATKSVPNQPVKPAGSALETDSGITDSGKIRVFVWKGAFDAWKEHPFFGTGVETFAYAYYRYRPVGHNLTSEWDYLYNKAHNEYLNYLATTGIFGLGSYLAIIALFMYLTLKFLISNLKSQISNQIKNSKNNNAQALEIRNWKFDIFIIALLAGYVTILITNFFGFSVVIINEYFFLIPAFVFILGGLLPDKAIVYDFASGDHRSYFRINPYQWTGMVFVTIFALFLLFSLYRFWDADTAYALGHNLDQVGQYQQAYQLLARAVDERPGEPVFADELAVNNATLATAFFLQKDTAHASELGNRAITINDQIIAEHPNNILFWKDRVRIFYTLAQINAQSLSNALSAMQQAASLAPTDAKIFYNLGVLYGETGQTQKAIDVLTTTTQLKPNYIEAYFALGLMYHQSAIDNKGIVIKPEFQQKAVSTLNYVLTNLDAGNTQVKKTLKSWGAA